MLAAAVDDLAQIDGASVAQLARPVAELVPAVAHRERLHAGQQPIAAEDLCEHLLVVGRHLDVEEIGHLVGMGHECGGRDGRGAHPRPTGLPHLPTAVDRVGISGQFSCEPVCEPVCESQRLEARHQRASAADGLHQFRVKSVSCAISRRTGPRGFRTSSSRLARRSRPSHPLCGPGALVRAGWPR